MQNKQGSRNIGIDKTHPTASRGEARSTASPPRTFWLKEWQEARGILQHVDLAEGNLTFEGFIVRIPPRLLEPMSCLPSLIGEKISIIRTDSITHPLVVRWIQSSSQEYRCNGECRESYSDTRCLEATDVTRCSRYNQV